MIAAFQAMDRWVENDAYIPSPGDYIFYDWDDTGAGDCTGWPEHVGIVISVSGDVIKVIEGNKDDAVGYREIKVNGRYIRGYGVPDYGAKTVIKKPESVTGKPENVTDSTGNGSLCMTPKWVGVVTGDILNVRAWAGEEYPNRRQDLRLFPFRLYQGGVRIGGTCRSQKRGCGTVHGQ